MSRRWIVAVVVGLALVLVLGTVVLAQGTTATPTPQATPGKMFRGGLFGGHLFGGGWGNYDAIAKALNLTPTQLFEQLHSGKTLDEIATAQGVDLQKLQDAAKAAQLEAMKQKIADMVKAGTITQEQADWMLKGLENGWGFGGRGGFGHGGRGFFGPGINPNATPKSGTFAPVAPWGGQLG
jgi:hypothetical protein